jgi:hypothetical protein
MKPVWGGVFAVCILLLMSGVAVSDECPRPEVQPMSRSVQTGAPATNFYYSASGTFLEADGEEGFLVLDVGSEGAIQFPLDGGFKMSADKRTRLHGIKNLSLTDFHRGDRVQVKFSSFDGRVVRLKLQRPKK